MNYILDKTGNPILEPDILKWARWFETADRQIARTELPGDVTVSTVFLAIDHGYSGPPILYETMVFGGPLDEEQERYTTRQAAIEGHEQMVARARTEGGSE